ncbi:MAG TPA: MazG nucleotide pyrophosphohydrolase domain-containing protein [Chloroflexia bacterium]|nr:MazG nucleotide pyrophosphohydrolase domain-containing protein [Chloroflexia bacterium]
MNTPEDELEAPLFQRKVAAFVSKNGLEIEVPYRLLDLTSELGELAKEALKGSNYGQESFQPTPEWFDELADVFFSLVCVANSTGLNLEEGLEMALSKYQERLVRKGSAGSEEG